MDALSRRLPAVLAGNDQARDNTERLGLAKICYGAKRYATAVRFWSEALTADPSLGNDRKARHRYNAACAAALAAAGQGVDEPASDETARTKLRALALAWLKAEADSWAKLIDNDAKASPQAVQVLRHWLEDLDLTSVRNASALTKLPGTERKDWQKLWAEVYGLLQRATIGRR
jgi:hypothetical protein